MITYLSIALNFLVIAAFIVDRIYRISSIKEYKEAKTAQIEGLKQAIELSDKFNDNFVAERLKKRVEDLQLIIISKEEEIEKNKNLIPQNQAENEAKLLADNFQNKIDDLEQEIANLKAEEFKGKYSLHLHELRRPIATIMGIISLYDSEGLDIEEVMGYLKESISQLDVAMINLIGNSRK